MEFAVQILGSQIAERWSTVLLQFVWQGCVIAGITSLTLRMLVDASSHVRYVVTLLSLVACVVSAAITFCTAPGDRSSESVAESVAVGIPDIGAVHSPAESVGLTRQVSLSPTDTARENRRLPNWRIAIVLIWLFGQIVLASRMTLGWIVLQRIRSRAHEITSDVRLRSRMLAQRMGLRRVPLVLASDDAGDAAAFGFVRSVVLLPTAWITEMSPEMIEAVLAHEFSHIRSNDTWVNLIQRLVESAFFFHPAVWWLSKQIRMERERCRDAEAVRITGCRDVFARALEHAARHRAGSRLSLVSNLGEDRMSLLDRINRVLGLQPIRTNHSGWQFGVVALLVPALMVWNISDHQTIAQELLELKGPAADVPLEVAEPMPVTPVEALPGGARVKQSNYYAAVAESPSERAKVSLPKYRIGPPDVLLIQAVQLPARSTYTIQYGDVLRVDVPNAKTDKPIAGSFEVERDGTINIGSSYGAINVAGKTILEAEKTITEFLVRWIDEPDTSVTLRQTSGVQNVAGEHLVGPDGHVNLGIYGTVYVAGMTTEETRTALEKRLSAYFQKPKISVAVLAYNSSYYYLITKGSGLGDNLFRLPVTGNETVLDAIAQVGGLEKLSEKSIWIARPAPDSGGIDQILPVDWRAITRGADASTNYQILPGDRVFVSDEATGHVLIQKNTDVESVVEKFNRLVEQEDYDDAIKVARNLNEVHPKNAMAIALQHHADLIEKNVLAKTVATHEYYAGLVDEIHEQYLHRHQIERALSTSVRVDFADAKLHTVVQFLSNHAKIDLSFDKDGLAAEDVSKDTLVTLQLEQKATIKTLLHLCLEPLGLTYTLRGDGIVITSPKVLHRHVVVAYDIGDLLGLPFRMNGVNGELDGKQFAEWIPGVVSPGSWRNTKPRYFPANESLVVSNTPKVHDEVSQLIKKLSGLSKEMRRERAK